MPRARPSPVVLTSAQKIQSWRKRAETFRAIAASSRDETARKTLLERAQEWEKKADEAEKI